jgi:hypothetical protein
MSSDLQAAIDLISGHELDTIFEGLDKLEKGLTSYNSDEIVQAADAVGSLFFIDQYERPDLVPVNDRAIEVLTTAGAAVIPYIIQTFENSDMKANLSFAKVLGRIGVPAIPQLMEFYRTAENSYSQSYALYAIGKIKDRAILAVLPDLIDAVGSEHLEVRDSAIRAVGKTMELINERDLSKEQSDNIFDKLFMCISDPHSAIRAKTIRTLGKMERCGILNNDQHTRLINTCRRIVGEDDQNRWDRAFIVRKEAQETLERMLAK